MWLCQRPNPHVNGPTATVFLLWSLVRRDKMGQLSFLPSWSQEDQTQISHLQASPGANSSPGMNQPPARSPLSLPLLEHTLGTWMSMQPGHRAQPGARRTPPAPAEHVPPSVNVPFLLAGCSNPQLGALPAPRAASMCHGLPTRSGNSLNKGISPKGPWASTSIMLIINGPKLLSEFAPIFYESLSLWKLTRESHHGGYDERWNCRTSPTLQVEKLQNLSARVRDKISRKSLLAYPKLCRSVLKFGSPAHFFTNLPFQFFCSANFAGRGFPRQLSVWIQHQCNIFPPERFLNQF